MSLVLPYILLLFAAVLMWLGVYLPKRYGRRVEEKLIHVERFGHAPGIVHGLGDVRTVAIDVRPALSQPFYGIAVYVKEVVAELVRLDQSTRFVLFTASRRDSVPTWIKEVIAGSDNVQSVHLRFSTKGLNYAANLSGARFLSDFVGPARIFHATNYLNFRIRGARSITSVYDLSFLIHPEFKRPRDPYEWAAKYRAKRSDRIVTISVESKNRIIERLATKPERVSVLYGAANPSEFHPQSSSSVADVLKPHGLHAGKYFVYVGDDQRRKNLGRILAASEQLSHERPDLKLALVGVSTRDLEGHVLHRHRPDFVVPIGFADRADLPAFYSGALALVYPSLYEGFGLPVIEAMSCGTPVITSRSVDEYGGALEEIAGGSARLVDPNSVSEIETAMSEIAADIDLRSALQIAGFKRAADFSWKSTARQTLELYQEVM